MPKSKQVTEKGHFNVVVAIVKPEESRSVHGLHFLVKEGDTVKELIEYISEKSEYDEWELEDFQFCFRGALAANSNTVLTQNDGVVFIL